MTKSLRTLSGQTDCCPDDCRGVVDDCVVQPVGHAGNDGVAQLSDDTVFELVEPGPNPTLYDQRMQRGPHQKTKRELDACIEMITRNVCHEVPEAPESMARSIAEEVVMRNWRRRA